MLIVTTPTIEGAEIEAVLGMVRGNTTRARFVGRDIIAGLKMLAGGEISEYTELLMDARDQSVDRMIDEAEKLGANAIVNVRFASSSIARGLSEILAYGTAVRIIKSNM
ncbi:MAG: YbjQ family protein [Bacteroidetes bacterium]|nr:YbjQ family protein [Bacteroidota bacterium]MCB0851854.1 YbjQ family protein [Bacteroidota bacterium]